MMKGNILLLLLAGCVAWARDPFLPTDTASCLAGKVSPVTWQIQGTIGRPGHYEAWLISPAEKRQRVRIHERLAGSEWQIAHIDLRSVTLTDGTSCQPPLTLVLKGRQHVKDSRSYAVTDERSLQGK